MDTALIELAERLGTAIAVAVVLGFWLKWLIAENTRLRDDLKEEREYSKSLGDRAEVVTERFTDTMTRQEVAFTLLKDGLK